MLQRNRPRRRLHFRQPGQRTGQRNIKPALNRLPRRRLIRLKIMHRAPHLPRPLLPQHPEHRRMRLPRVKDHRQIQTARQPDVLPEHLILHPMLRRFRQIIQPHLANANHPVRLRQPLQFPINRIIHQAMRLARMYPHPGIQSIEPPRQPDTSPTGLHRSPRQNRRRNPHRRRPLQHPRQLPNIILVQMSMAIAKSQTGSHSAPHQVGICESFRGSQ